MNPLSAVRFLPALETAVASRYFGRYLIVAIVIGILFIIIQKNKKG